MQSSDPNERQAAGVVLPDQNDAPSEADRLVTALEEYRAALDAGGSVDREEFLQRYSDIAEELSGCLANLEFMQSIASELDAPARTAPPAAGTAAQTLGDYRIIREIGRGGMGVVYEAEQLSMKRRVALKVLPFAAVMDQRQLARFKNEAMAAGLLTHQNIVPVYSVGCEKGVHYYAMQYIEGQTLAEAIGQLRRFSGLERAGDEQRNDGFEVASQVVSGGLGPSEKVSHLEPTIDSGAAPQDDGKVPRSFPQAAIETKAIAALSTERSTKSPAFFRTIAQLGIQAAEALDHAHKQGVLHRDVKPANLILDSTGNLWMTDFGLARLEANPHMTMTGDLIGTLRYMSPEQALAKRIIVDHRTDIYSLGVTLYELLTLHPAYPGRDRQELLKQIAFSEPKAPRRINAAIPAELETITLKAMAKNPEERYATAQELADDLRRWQLHEPIRAKRPSLVHRARKWSRRHSAILTASVATALFAFGISTVLIWNAYSRESELRSLAQQRADEADRSAKLAQANLRQAGEAIDRMLTKVAEEPLLQEGRLLKFREGLLKDAAELSNNLVQTNSTDPAVRLETAKAYRRLAGVHQMLAQNEDALKYITTAVETATLLVREFPKVATYRVELNVCRLYLGSYSLKVGRTDVETARAVVRLAEELASEEPTFKRRWGVPDALMALSASLRHAGRRQESEQTARTAIRLFEGLLEERDGANRQNWDEGYRGTVEYVASHLGQAYNYLADWAEPTDTETLTEVETLIRKHLQWSREFYKDLSEDEFLQAGYVRANYHYLGVILGQKMGRWEEAVDPLSKAARGCLLLLEKHPDNMDERYHAGTTYGYLSEPRFKTGDEEGGMKDLRKALEILTDVEKLPLESSDYRRSLWIVHNNLSYLLLLRDPDEALKLAEKAVEFMELVPESTPDSLHHLACARYLTGDYEAAVAAYERDSEFGSGYKPWDWLWRAMAHYRLGQEQPARAWREKFDEWARRNPSAVQNETQHLEPHKRAMARRVLAEAETLFGYPYGQRPDAPRESDTTGTEPR